MCPPDLGIGESLAALGSWLASGATAVGVGADTAGILGSTAADALGGAAAGAGEAALTGGNIGKGAELGGITGGTIGGLTPAIADVTGLSTGLSSTLAGVVGGAGGAALTGGNPLTGGLEGGVGGFISGGGLGPSTGPAATPGASGGGGGSAAASAIPGLSTAGGLTSPDLTAIGGTGGTGGIGDIANVATVTPTPGSTISDPGITGALNATNIGTGPNLTGPIGTVAPAGTGTAAVAGPTSVDKFLSDPSFGSAFGVLKANPTDTLSALGLGYDISQNRTPPQLKTLEGEASTLQAQGNYLSSAIFNGNLPPAAKQAVDQATASAKAAIRAQYGQLGLSGSTMETQALNQVDEQASTQVFDIANSMLSQGLKITDMSDQLFQAIMQSQEAQNKDITSAIAGFSAAIAGGGARPAAAA